MPAPADHWAFRPVVTREPVRGAAAQLATTLDRLVAARRAGRGLHGSPPADRVTLIRRLFLDMHGIPPTPQQVAGFVADERPTAWRELVDEVLASPRYGERWAQHWLDVVRYADTHGFEVNTPRPHAWPYRDWVIRSLNEDLPYDRFVQAQIAGDALDAPAATGFLVAGPAVLPGQVGKDLASRLQARQDQLDEIVKATGTTFLALTVGCARCHDHKFDPLTQTDYYAMQAVFAGVQYADRALPDPRRERAAAALAPRLDALRDRLRQYEPVIDAHRTIVLDDEDPPPNGQLARGVQLLHPRTGHGSNPAGAGRGQRDDAGDRRRSANISGGRYSWWQDAEGQDLLLYRPGRAGEFRIWLSWGAGFATHTAAAHYLLDQDGDPATRGDQRLLVTIDQRQFADPHRGQLAGQPLWSGLRDVGVHRLDAGSAVLLRGGPGTATTGDLIVLQAAAEGAPPPAPAWRPPVRARHNVERFAPLRARFVRFTVHAVNSRHEPCIDELEVYTRGTPDRPGRNVALAAGGARATSSGDYPGNPRHRLAHIHDGRYGNDRSWISDQSGQGWVQIELAETVEIDRIEWARDRQGRYTDRTPTRYTITVAEHPDRWRVVATGEDRVPAHPTEAAAVALGGLSGAQAAAARQLAADLRSLEARHAELRAPRLAYAGTFGPPPVMHRLHRGNPGTPREAVAPDAPRVFGSLRLAAGAPEQQRRLALARWLTAPDHPLTARVMVNRIWQHHFGQGIVDTPSDFGHSGSKPSHPLLLDWLAAVLPAGGWSLKHLHRVILLSATYRQASTEQPTALRTDGANRLLWRFAPRRLEAEAIRDSILAVSGALDLRMGGPGFDLFEPNANYVRNYVPKSTWTKDTWRRMVYAHKVRMEQDGVFGAFDCPDAGQTAPRRSRSTTPLQSLNLFNSGFVVQQAGILAQRVAATRPPDPVRRAFELTLGRPPTAAEASAAAGLLREHGLPALCRVLLNTNEFLVLP